MKILKSIILLSLFSICYANTNPDLDTKDQEFDQSLCVQQRLKHCIDLCSQKQSHCEDLCTETVKNQCRYAGE